MVTLSEYQEIAAKIPGAIPSPTGPEYSVLVKGKPKGFAWFWRERVHPKKPKQTNLDVLVVRVRGLAAKDLIIASNPTIYFTEPHYNGYAAILVRLSEINAEELEEILAESARIARNAKS
jgi:hypothetical protein